MDLSHPEYKDIVRSMEYASIIGVKHIVVHSLKAPTGVSPVEINRKYY
jgi:hypothetical protein